MCCFKCFETHNKCKKVIAKPLTTHYKCSIIQNVVLYQKEKHYVERKTCYFFKKI